MLLRLSPWVSQVAARRSERDLHPNEPNEGLRVGKRDAVAGAPAHVR
jgi:hypothetical protein